MARPKIKTTPAQETSLNKLFSGNHVDREQVVSIHQPQAQEQLRALLKAKGNADKLFAILFSDLKHASSEMKAHPGDQFWRRTTIRTVAATLDGIVFCLKQTAHATGPMNGFIPSGEELFFLTEEITGPATGKKPKLLGFRENIKRTFKLFAAVYRIPCPTDFGHSGFAALCETYELRHRLMHPKSFMTFYVSDDEKERAGEAIQWLDNEIMRLFDSCSAALQ